VELIKVQTSTAISRIRPITMERVASVNLPQYMSTALSVMTGLIQDIATSTQCVRMTIIENH
jgi:hypothetical protein